MSKNIVSPDQYLEKYAPKENGKDPVSLVSQKLKLLSIILIVFVAIGLALFSSYTVVTLIFSYDEYQNCKNVVTDWYSKQPQMNSTELNKTFVLTMDHCGNLLATRFIDYLKATLNTFFQIILVGLAYILGINIQKNKG